MLIVSESKNPYPADPPTRFEKHFWQCFLFLLVAPLFISILSPLTYPFFVPAIGSVFFIAHRVFFKIWPWLRLPLAGFMPLMMIFIALMFCSALWSIEPLPTFLRACKVAGLMAGAFALLGVAQACPASIWRRHYMIFPFAALLLGAITNLDIMTGMHFFNSFNHKSAEELRPDFLNKHASVFVMLLPLMLYLSKTGRSILLVAMIISTAIVTFILTFSQACQLSLLVMLLGAFGCLSFLEKITLRAVFLSLSFVFLMLPWIAPTLFDLLAARLNEKTGLAASASASLRLENWDFLSRRILENPLNGFGMDATRYMSFETQQLYFHNNSIMHPHNIILQMWIEFGLFGAVWALGFFGFLYLLLMKLRPAMRHVAFLTFCGLMIFMLVSWSMWASWLIALIFYLATLCVLAAKTSNAPLPA